jgi:hypothetical protein
MVLNSIQLLLGGKLMTESVKHTPMGRQVVDLLRRMNHPVATCAADLIEEYKKDVRYYEEDCSGAYDYSAFRSLRRDLEDYANIFSSAMEQREERIMSLVDQIRQLDILVTGYELEIKNLKFQLGGEADGSGSEGAR